MLALDPAGGDWKLDKACSVADFLFLSSVTCRVPCSIRHEWRRHQDRRLIKREAESLKEAFWRKQSLSSWVFKVIFCDVCWLKCGQCNLCVLFLHTKISFFQLFFSYANSRRIVFLHIMIINMLQLYLT